MSSNPLEKQGKVWLMARDVIADAIHETVLPSLPQQLCEQCAIAIIARLAAHDPPLVIGRGDEE